MKSNRAFYMLAWLLAVASVAEANAQTEPYPNKPVQIITDSAAGSTPDVALRIVADGLTQGWKQQVLVNNHPGAGGSLAPCSALCRGLAIAIVMEHCVGLFDKDEPKHNVATLNCH